MDNQSQQRFCTNCGQPLAPAAAFCVACGMQASAPPTGAPGPFSAEAQPGYPPSYAQAPTQAQDDPLPALLAAGYLASRRGRHPQVRARRPGSRLRGCGCILFILAVLAGPFIGMALTSGRLQLIFTYVAIGMVILFFLLWLIAVLVTRRGREALSEGLVEGCLEAILGGLFGGG